ncbi:hypothetical protein [Rhodococcus sp. SGAir0479]|uniref:hypothetical protein n=1 Tax=Rhodococcus sp. SGAir0479 TaxID=2567884 RepID=UPI0010CCB769|nr:hypothetical protein [Rhodococcus sp. SGAir0479]QCQ89784.1 hypothetical protein E7742_00215 [Rhodococcus sp. SGAir0479]
MTSAPSHDGVDLHCRRPQSHRPELLDGVGLIVGIDRFMSEERPSRPENVPAPAAERTLASA